MALSGDKNSGAVTEKQVLDALATVMDPDLQRDIVSLGFIKDLAIDGGEVSFTIELTTPACPVKQQMHDQAQSAVESLDGVASATITMTSQVPQRRGSGDKQAIPGVRNVLVVASGKGGVGKTTTAVNIALSLSQTGAKVGILDADVYGPNIPQMLGVEEEPTSDGNSIIPPSAYGIRVISMGLLMERDQPVIWRGPMLHSVVQQFLRDTQWGELDYLVVDMPPGTGDVQITLTQTVPLSGVVIVTTPSDVAVTDVRRGVQMFRQLDIPITGVVENMASFIAPDTGKEYFIFGKGGGEKVAQEYDIPYLGRIPIDPRIAEGGDTGKPIVIARPDSDSCEAFRKVAGQLAAQVSKADLEAPAPQPSQSPPIQIGGLGQGG